MRSKYLTNMPIEGGGGCKKLDSDFDILDSKTKEYAAWRTEYLGKGGKAATADDLDCAFLKYWKTQGSKVAGGGGGKRKPRSLSRKRKAQHINAWVQFIQDCAGSGLNFSELSAIYRQ